MSISVDDINQWEATYNGQSPQDILGFALEQFSNIAISFSGAEDVVLVDMGSKILGDKLKVFSLDTGRLHQETYEYLEKVRDHYGIQLEFMFPEASAVEQLTREKGLYSFLKTDHKECCAVRKIAPLRRKLSTLDAWVTGQRKDQSPTRTDVPAIQKDGAFSSADKTLVKFNPLVNWSSAQVWDYIRSNNVPYNPLHERGFTSIGCQPCTRPVLPNQHEREGRWWWEEATQKECGLHSANIEK